VRRVALALIAASLLGAAAAPAADVSLRIIFPEGMSVRQMADQVAAVRRIAIRTRHVTPVLTGKAYAVAAATTSPPPAFRAADKRHSIEGFLFPAGYDFGPATKPIELSACSFRRSSGAGRGFRSGLGVRTTS
jgi:cell division protein YceG involved in septum cleavage